MIRVLDTVISTLGLIILSPFFLIISILIKIDSKGPVFYRQLRVGKNNADFILLKFRSMVTGAEKAGFLTIGGRDHRITHVGFYLRKYKIDELPQLINVLCGQMSLVGPRPEVRRYVNLYTTEQMKVLEVRPGITDIASIVYKSENEILAQAQEPEKAYIEQILPDKIRLNMEFINHPGIIKYFEIIFKTLF
ncbi:MAG: sugar transferase [Bacteroidota bacterium]|nr:sugar transferase [Bacteroidota bacterium]